MPPDPTDPLETLGKPQVRGVVRGHVVAAVGVRSQLVRSFDAATGMSPMAYLRQMRVERMARLLVSTDLPVGEAARSVGWKNQFHASQCFHAACGVSPTEYRRRQLAPPVR